MENLTLFFLSHDWAGLVLALIVAGIAWLWWRRAGARGRRWSGWAAGAVLAVGAAMMLGSLYHLFYMAHVRGEHPAPGKLVDVGGYRLHVLAEGDAGGRPPIVWMPGAHSAGFYLYHLHRALRSEVRSILIDRPGAGWSDIGSFPRSTAIESTEIVTALERSGEKGPYIFAGHSLGGLLVANIARRRPDLVAAVVLLDATPPDAINYAPSNPFLQKMRRDALLGALQRLFGIHRNTAERLWGGQPAPDAAGIDKLVETRLGAALGDVRAIEDGARSNAANASIFNELAPGGLGWNGTVYDGDLGDLPVYLVAPRDLPELKGTAEQMTAQSGVTVCSRVTRRDYCASMRARVSATWHLPHAHGACLHRLAPVTTFPMRPRSS